MRVQVKYVFVLLVFALIVYGCLAQVIGFPSWR